MGHIVCQSTKEKRSKTECYSSHEPKRKSQNYYIDSGVKKTVLTCHFSKENLKHFLLQRNKYNTP